MVGFSNGAEISASFVQRCRILTIFMALIPSLAYADDCDAILSQGIKNTYKELRTSNFEQEFKSAVCNEKQSAQSSGRNSSGSFRYKLVSGAFGSSRSSVGTTLDKLCSSGSGSVSSSDFIDAMKTEADANIVRAWESCKSSRYGVIINGELNDDDLAIT